MTGIAEWMEEVSGKDWVWCVKFLSGNDTLANGTHQAGPYLPRQTIFELFPSLRISRDDNPRVSFETTIDSHGVTATPQAIWYNNRLRGGTRNECRLTGWGGRESPLLDPEATGSLCVIAFFQPASTDASGCRIWLCGSAGEEDAVVERSGAVEPGNVTVLRAGESAEVATPADRACTLDQSELPDGWQYAFPDAQSLVDLAIARLPSAARESPDLRLVRRRTCEFALYRSVEDAVILPRVSEGFSTIDVFVNFANSVTNRRKSRSGRSLEWHARRIFDEENLSYAHGAISEGGKLPDFLFPSADAYQNAAYPAHKLQMLGVKTTCKDRWRQILEEADRIPNKCLLTLQEGVSVSQFEQMTRAGIVLVVPAPLQASYHESIRPSLLSLEAFIGATKALQA